MQLDKSTFRERVNYWIDRGTGDGVEGATHRHIFEAVSRAVMDTLWDQWRKYEHTVKSQKLKRVYYFSAEFLMGRALGNNLLNLKLREEVAEVLSEMGLDLNAAEDTEPDRKLLTDSR